jgi:hypothetical protein
MLVPGGGPETHAIPFVIPKISEPWLKPFPVHWNNNIAAEKAIALPDE